MGLGGCWTGEDMGYGLKGTKERKKGYVEHVERVGENTKVPPFSRAYFIVFCKFYVYRENIELPKHNIFLNVYT